MLIEKNGIEMPAYDWTNQKSVDAWNEASKSYAEQVSGEVHAIIGDTLRDGNTWETVELPTLINNQNVTRIFAVDPKTGIETVVFERFGG